MQLSIIIVNFNVKYFLEQCLYSVIKACKHIEAEIFVVDNHSTDGSLEYFAGRFAEVTFIWNRQNVGFSKANNQVLQKARGEFILFLNPDTIVPEDCLAKCIDFISGQNDAGALGVRMVDGNGYFLKESKRGYPSPVTSLCKLSGLAALFPSSRFFARYYLGHLNPHTNHEVDVLSGAFMLVRKKALDKTGGFDELFFMYGEDIDLSYRIRAAGFTNRYYSETTIIHFKGESTQKRSLQYVRLFYGAMSLFARKHYNRGTSRMYNIMIQPAIWIKAMMAGTVLWIKGKLPGKDAVIGKYFIVGSNKEASIIISALQNGKSQVDVIGRVAILEEEENGAIGKVSELSQLIAKHKVSAIIFCINTLSTKRIIELTGLLPLGTSYLFHFEGSFGMVGSNLAIGF